MDVDAKDHYLVDFSEDGIDLCRLIWSTEAAAYRAMLKVATPETIILFDRSDYPSAYPYENEYVMLTKNTRVIARKADPVVAAALENRSDFQKRNPFFWATLVQTEWSPVVIPHKCRRNLMPEILAALKKNATVHDRLN